MNLAGIHHVTAITADAQPNVDFYTELLGLRLVKKTVNFDAPQMYHLYYGDEIGAPGSILTFFEIPGAAPGSPGAGMIHRTTWSAPADSLDFWAERLDRAGISPRREGEAVIFADPEGLGHELVAAAAGPPPIAAAAGIPAEHALRGIAGVRAYAVRPQRSRQVLTEILGFRVAEAGSVFETGTDRRGRYLIDPPPSGPARPGAGTVHHVAWAAADADHQGWSDRLAGAGVWSTGIVDRQYFRSIYFREPNGVLFEIATLGPGFLIDEPAEQLGQGLRLPPQYESQRGALERSLRPLRVPDHMEAIDE